MTPEQMKAVHDLDKLLQDPEQQSWQANKAALHKSLDDLHVPLFIGLDCRISARVMWLAEKYQEQKTFLSLLNVLREPEGATVTFGCDNPDFNGQPNSLVLISDDWTNWYEERFTGDTLLEALQNAVKAREERKRSEHAPEF